MDRIIRFQSRLEVRLRLNAGDTSLIQQCAEQLGQPCEFLEHWRAQVPDVCVSHSELRYAIALLGRGESIRNAANRSQYTGLRLDLLAAANALQARKDPYGCTL